MDDRQFGYRDEDGPRPAMPPDEPPPWIVSPPSEDDHPPRRRSGRLPFVVAGLAVVLVLVTAGAAVLVMRSGLPWRTAGPAVTQPGGDAGGGVTPIEPEPVTEPVTEPTTEPVTEPTTDPAPTTDPEQAALDELDEITAGDLHRVRLNGQFVAQLASKNPGIVDKFQRTAGGSHTFRAVDILRQHQQLRDDPANDGVPVVLLKSTDYGKRQLYRGMPLYVTFALGDFAGPEDVRRWCAGRFPDLSGDALGNQCAVRRLRPPA